MSERPRILVVEDSSTQAAFLQEVLEGNGWETLAVPAAEAALEAVPGFAPQLFVVDYHLPGMGGDELCRQLRMRLETRTIPIVMVTGHDADGVAEEVFESGADDFIVKSADSEHLVHRVRNLLRQCGSARALLSNAESFVRHARVLAVEDSATYAAYLRAELAGEPYGLETAAEGLAALERLTQERYDCVVVDLVMPGMDGIAVCRAIHERYPPGASRPLILMLTGREDLEALRCALDAGADDFARKSTNASVLKARIRALLRRKFFEDGNERILAELTERELRAQKALLEKEAVEARAKLVDQLERTNRELEEFVSVAAHDLKSPLRTIGSLAQLVERRAAAVLDERACRDIERIVEAARRMGRVIDDLLDYARLKGPSEPPSAVDLDGVLREVRRDLEEEIRAAGALVSWGELPSVAGSPSDLVRLFQNLVSNAVKFRGPAPPEVRVSWEATPEGDHFRVTDNGIGIDPAQHRGIFAPFKRLHSEREYPGTGIGLAACKRIVERMGGEIWVESEPGQGTTVHVALPAPGAAAVAAAER